MATTSGFFNSINGDRRYLAQNFASYFASFIGNGVFPNPSNGLQVYASTNMNVTVKSGRAWINGYDFINDSDYNLIIERADGVLNRIDRIVVRLDLSLRQITIEIKKGTFASSPVAPTLQRDSVIHELGIADVYVGKGVTTISQSYITDLRLNSNYCGIVAGVVEQIDTSSVFNQYQDWFNTYSIVKAQEFADWQQATKDVVAEWIQTTQTDFETWMLEQTDSFLTWRMNEENEMSQWRTNKEKDFSDWFSYIKGQLSTDAAGNLQNQIIEHTVSELPHFTEDATTGKRYFWGFGLENGEPFLAFKEVNE